MKGCLPSAARAGAGILAAVFVLTLPLSLLAFNLGRVAFSPERMTGLLTEIVVETGGLRRLMVESLTAGSPDEPEPEGGLNLREGLGFLTPQERDYLGVQLAPAGWGEEQVGALVSSLFEWIDNDRAGPEFVLHIAELKGALLSGGAAELIELMVDSWPPCSVSQAEQMGVEVLLGEKPLILCEPPEPVRTGLIGVLNVSMAVSLRALPDRISLSDAQAGRPASAEVLETKESIRTARFLAGWSWLLSPALLGLVMALVVRSWRDLGLWWGIPLVVGAVLSLVAMALLRLAAGEALGEMLADPETPDWLGAMIARLVEAVLAVTLRRTAFQAGLLLVVGVGLFFGGRALERRSLAPGAPSPADATTLSLPVEDEVEPPGQPPTGMFG